MITPSRRYVFIDYSNLEQIKFGKLEKVASRIFVFIEAGQEQLPISLIRKTQNAGKRLRWVIVPDTPGGNLYYHMAFVMGKLHEKVDLNVKFALVSDDEDLDPLIAFINDSGRGCIRIKRKNEEDETLAEPTSAS